MINPLGEVSNDLPMVCLDVALADEGGTDGRLETIPKGEGRAGIFIEKRLVLAELRTELGD